MERKKHPYEEIALWALNSVIQESHWWNCERFAVKPEDKTEGYREAVSHICQIVHDRPKMARGHEGYLFVSAKRSIKNFWLGSHGKPHKTNKGWLPHTSVVAFGAPGTEQAVATGWLDRNAGKYDPDYFVEDHLAQIHQLLLALRKKKGVRGQSAAMRDMQIIRFAALGWTNQEIGQELGIPGDHIKKYRQSIIRSLKQCFQQERSNALDAA
ncbi:MAG: hypothetical protein HC851_17300 [Acaryochloris sp. RU_4_1]|nr:hypothetical protein [Acaryochloris sp. RU_4_1]NJR55411.1 hypothetical protein [Acaryochloris sp. CRU_2_0]